MSLDVELDRADDEHAAREALVSAVSTDEASRFAVELEAVAGAVAKSGHGVVQWAPTVNAEEMQRLYDLAPRVGLHPGTARAALRKAVLAAKNGDPR